MRERYNLKIRRGENDIEQAALLIFLNKHCFNGLYRVNAEGLFNVPYNKSQRSSYSRGNLTAASLQLRNAEILCGDFEAACRNAGEKDFVFLDSPYAPLKADSFLSYTRSGFPREDHERLAGLFRRLDRKGAYCMLTNHDTPFIRSLYEGYRIEAVAVKRLINSDASNRVGREVIIRNY